MIKNIFQFILIISNIGILQSQNIVNEGIFRIEGTSTDVYFGYDYTNKTDGTHENKGNLYIDKNFTNNGTMTATDATNGKTHFINNVTALQKIKGNGNNPIVFKNLRIFQFVPGTGPWVVTVANGLELRVINSLVLFFGSLKLIGSSQLVQTHSGTSLVTSSGNNTANSSTNVNVLYKDQIGITTNVYQSGYWSSPVSTDKIKFTLEEVLKDGSTATSDVSNPPNINFTSSSIHDGASTSPITISGKWLAKLVNASDWTREIDPATSTGEQFNIGEGWNMKSTGSLLQNFTFKGVPNDGDYSSTIDDGRLSLIGNPYPSALDANQFITDNTSAIAGTLYFYESGNDVSHQRGNYLGGYATYNGTTGVAYNGGIIPQRYIPVGQAFFVFRDVTNGGGSGTIGSSASINFNNAQRVFQTRAGSSNFFSKKIVQNNSKAILKIGVEFTVENQIKFHRQLAIGFIGKTSNYENGFDAEIFGKNPTDITLKVDNHPGEFVIIGTEYFSENLSFPLKLTLDKNREFSFLIDEQINFSNEVFLYDKKLKRYHNLKGEKEVFISLDKGVYNNRFFIVFNNKTLSVDDVSLVKKIDVFYSKKDDCIKIINHGNEKITSVDLYNTLGQEIKSIKNIGSQNYLIKVQNTQNRVLVIKIKTGKEIITKKIIQF